MGADIKQAGIINGARQGANPAFTLPQDFDSPPSPQGEDEDAANLAALNAGLETQKNAAIMAAARSLETDGQSGLGGGEAQAIVGNAAASAPAYTLPISFGPLPNAAPAKASNLSLAAGVPGQVAAPGDAAPAQMPLSNMSSDIGFIADGPVTAGGEGAIAQNPPGPTPADPYDVAMLAAAGVRPVDAASNRAFAPDRQAAMDEAAGEGADSDGKDLAGFGAGADGESADSTSQSAPGQTPGNIGAANGSNQDGSTTPPSGEAAAPHPISKIADKDILNGRANPVGYATATVDRDNKVINIAVKVNYEKTSFFNPTATRVSDEEYNRLVTLADAGVARYWSRTVTLDGQEWQVNVSATNARDGMPITVAYPGWKILGENLSERSFNTWPFYEGTIYYRPEEGDPDFSLTSAHEIGHSFLTDGVGIGWSWGHEDTSSILGSPHPDIKPYPATGPIGLMPYYGGKQQPPGYYNRSIASENDVKTLLYISGRGK
ncbi:MAG TPA: hypothetical protein VF798_06155 [Burkholderiaceae bacterium]